VSRGQRGESPAVVNLSFLDRQMSTTSRKIVDVEVELGRYVRLSKLPPSVSKHTCLDKWDSQRLISL
jgi:hypothetical protein